MRNSVGFLLVSLLSLGIAWMLWMPAPSRQGVSMKAWEAYRSRYVTADGRVIDTGNHNTSHSEGQGFGMLLAVAAGDRAEFDRLWRWTRTHLRVREDALFAWQWIPDQAGGGKIADRNNASDGDLYIAWGLVRAAKLWDADYGAEALAILAAVRASLVRQFAGYTVLLPGVYGFSDAHGITLNLSYWLYPAFREFYVIDPNPIWNELTNSGLKLLERARFGRWQLPADWVLLTASGDLRLANNHSPRFGFDAVRIPLLLKWGRIDRQDLYSPYQDLLVNSAKGDWPAWVDLQTDAFAEYPASLGAKSLLQLSGPQRPEVSTTDLPASLDYYGASLWMLGQVAAAEISP